MKCSTNSKLSLLCHDYSRLIKNVIKLILLNLTALGHCAVGSIVGASNAKVASLIGADMVLVANGGLVSRRTQ